MTREEAINTLNASDYLWCRPNEKEQIALNMAIDALTSQNLTEPNNTCEVDLISRADAIKAIRKCKFDSDMPSYWYRGMENAQDIIENIPSTELPKGDLISRKVLMDRLESFCKWCKDGRLQGAEFVWDCIVTNVPSADAVEVVWCKDCRHQEHCHETAAHTKDHDGFREHWSEPIEWCSRGERREE